MNTKLFIPQKIKVGYQERTDTFTKKLAYVIYYDEKGVLRKEKSWQGWRDSKIEPLDIENTPYSGFTLNKGILRDGYWGGGHNMVRIYDDRGIEFEITVSNLMYILMGNDCNKRVLSGEFVYAWNGTELVLLPTNTEEYNVSTTFTSLKTNKVTMKEMKENVGCVFKTKDLEDWVYLGKLEYNESNWVRREKDYVRTRVQRHVFYNIKNKRYFYETSANKLAYLVEPTKVHDYEDLLEGYFNSNLYVQISEVVLEVGEDISHRFTREHKYSDIVEGGGYVYFIGNNGKYYHAYRPYYANISNNFTDLCRRKSRTLYFAEMPVLETRGVSIYNERLFNDTLEKQSNSLYNEGFTEWNIKHGGLKFNLLKVTLKSVDGREILLKDKETLDSYFFTDDVKTTKL